MKLKIISDGTAHGTRVVNAKTGENVEGISKVHWDVRTGKLANCRLEIEKVEVELEADIDPSRDILSKARGGQ